jgi:hydrogenase/urease accessory protein HupE
MKHFIGGLALGVLAFMSVTRRPKPEDVWPWTFASAIFGTLLGLVTWGLWPWSAGIVCGFVTLGIVIGVTRRI